MQISTEGHFSAKSRPFVFLPRVWQPCHSSPFPILRKHRFFLFFLPRDFIMTLGDDALFPPPPSSKWPQTRHQISKVLVYIFPPPLRSLQFFLFLKYGGGEESRGSSFSRLPTRLEEETFKALFSVEEEDLVPLSCFQELQFSLAHHFTLRRKS